VTRSGSLGRATVAVRRDRLTGIVVQQSLFQRRAGLATVIVPIAAGRGHYHVLDVERTAGLALADEAVPGLVAPFLVAVDASAGEPVRDGTPGAGKPSAASPAHPLP
jgi:putative membrane protein